MIIRGDRGVIFVDHILKRSPDGSSVTIGLIIRWCWFGGKAFDGAAAFQDTWRGPGIGKN